MLGGSAAEHLDLFRAVLAAELARLAPWVPATSVVASSLDDLGGTVGAAFLIAARL